jgi:hypothetical protein
VDKVALALVFLQGLHFSPANYHFINAPFSRLSSGTATIDPFAGTLTVGSASSHPKSKEKRGNGAPASPFLLFLTKAFSSSHGSIRMYNLCC